VGDYRVSLSVNQKKAGNGSGTGIVDQPGFFGCSTNTIWQWAIADYRYACDNGEKEACRALKKLTGGE
jgi:hypothetical protein